MRKKPDILPPTKGVSYQLDDMYLDNLKHGKAPEGYRVELYIFVERTIETKLIRLGRERVHREQRRIVHTILDDSEAAAIEQLRRFASRGDVTLVDSQTGKRIPKEWVHSKEKEHGAKEHEVC